MSNYIWTKDWILYITGARGGVCSHNRAIYLFTESINQVISRQCKFIGQSWNLNTLEFFDSQDDAEMGINAELYRNQMGTYHVNTTGNKPFCDF